MRQLPHYLRLHFLHKRARRAPDDVEFLANFDTNSPPRRHCHARRRVSTRAVHGERCRAAEEDRAACAPVSGAYSPLTTNREALAIVRSLEPYVAGAPFIPNERFADQWINYWASAPDNSGRYRATANERVGERKRVLSSTPNGVPMPDTPPQVIEHVSIRAHFVRYVTPQLRKKEPKEEGRRLILVVYSLTGRWLFFHVAKVRPPYRHADLFKTKRSAHLIFGPQWEEFVERIRNTAREAAARDRVAVPEQFLVHVPADARWSSGLTAHAGEDVQVVKDMPKEDESGDRLMISVLRRAGTDVNKLELLFTSEPALSV